MCTARAAVHRGVHSLYLYHSLCLPSLSHDVCALPACSDLKPDNILLTPGGVVKLADFGHAARFPDGVRPQHHEVVTIWYRPPELLFRSRFHGPGVDMWSIGCIFGELLLRQPLFPGPNAGDREQMAAVIRLLGTPHDPLPPVAEAERAAAVPGRGGAAAAVALPVGAGTGAYSLAGAVVGTLASAAVPAAAAAASADASTAATTAAVAPSPPATPSLPPLPAVTAWPGCTSLPGYAEYEPRSTQPWGDILRSAGVAASPNAVDLLARLLAYDPAARISAADALAHPWFAAAPQPTPPEGLPLPAGARAALAAPGVGVPAAASKAAPGAPSSLMT